MTKPYLDFKFIYRTLCQDSKAGLLKLQTKKKMTDNLHKTKPDKIEDTKTIYRSIALQTDSMIIDSFTSHEDENHFTILSGTETPKEEEGDNKCPSNSALEKNRDDSISSTDIYKTVQEISNNVCDIRNQLKQLSINGDNEHEALLLDKLDSQNCNRLPKNQSTEVYADLQSKNLVTKNLFMKHVEDTSIEKLSTKIKTSPDFIFSDSGITTELHLQVAKQNTVNVLKILEAKETFINFRDESGRAPIHEALLTKNIHMIKILLKYGADPNVTDAALKNGLHYAVLTESISLIDIFVNKVKDIADKDKDGNTAVHLLALVDNSECCKHLLESVKAQDRSKLLDMRNNMEQSALHIAAYRGNVELTKLLIMYKCNLDLQDNQGMTPLHNAILSSSEGIKYKSKKTAKFF